MRGRWVLLACLAACGTLHAEVASVEVTSRQPWAGGQAFGDAGAYEVLRGTVHYEIDPQSSSARDVTDIRHAPVNAQGLVEYSGPFMLIRPVDAARGNHATLVEVANRGRTQMHGMFFDTKDRFDLMSSAPVPALVDGTVFELGYSVAWVGWQARLAPDEFGLQVPVADVRGRVRTTFDTRDMTPDRRAFDLTSKGFYCARDARQRGAVLRTQVSFDDPGVVIPRGSWRFAADKADPESRAHCRIELDQAPAGYTHFNLVYEGEAPAVAGLGLAAFRDFALHLKDRKVPSALNERPQDAKAVLAYGYSQGGRFLRDFVYRGFNTGSAGERAYDGMLVTAAGAGRGGFNHRHALSGHAGNSVMSNLRAVDIYPFADVPTPDIDGTGSEGLLDRATADGTAPKIFYTISSTEYWARVASLAQTTADGRQPVALGADSRLYYFAGTPHAPRRAGTFREAATQAAYPYNDNWDLIDGMAAQLEALRLWAMDSVPPPDSIAPGLGSTLVEAKDLQFPAIPAIRVPTDPPPVWQIDMGPDYKAKGILREPVRTGARYPLLVPAVDSDGNELGGWRGARASVPLGTYTAWNWQAPERASFGFISGLTGGFLPFARTRADRLAAQDPRLSIEERYGDREGYLRTVTGAIDDAIARRFLLPMQRDAIIGKMGKHWDEVAGLEWSAGQRQAAK